jgi:Ca2+-transporting ATPase
LSDRSCGAVIARMLKRAPPPITQPPSPHATPIDATLTALGTSPHGLLAAEAAARLARHGPNRLPTGRRPGLGAIILHQLKSPLHYLLIAAGLVALALGEHVDAAFIGLVILIDAVIGTIQEHGAERSAEALAALVPASAVALRDGGATRVAATDLVPGDVVLLEPGARVPADLRLIEASALAVDESLLTGESVAVTKDPTASLATATPLAERSTMAYGGTLVAAGRGAGVVAATGLATALGALAQAVGARGLTPPPLLVRMEVFARRLSSGVVCVAVAVALLGLARGMRPEEVFIACVALAVSAIPEGLPVGLTVALAIAARRMGRRHVIVRRLVAVEALGSCTWIASDKTGTLTRNQLTVCQLILPGPDGRPVIVQAPEADVALDAAARALLEAGALCNEAVMTRRADGAPEPAGDAVDVALIRAAAEAGIDWDGLRRDAPELAALPFEPSRRASASLRATSAGAVWFVKGAPEALLSRCAGLGEVPRGELGSMLERLGAEGFRMLALARTAPVTSRATTRGAGALEPDVTSENSLPGPLRFLGIVAMQDPLRPEARAAVDACRSAGITVAMVTGDHPATALAIARQLGLAERAEQVVTGAALSEAEASGRLAEVVLAGRVFARVEPGQKTRIVETLAAAGHFVAVTGDGANDAPALKAAHVGVAMGGRGTDVAREAASLILTDDHFASIVAGVEEGRVAYANVRKVTFLLVTTGAAEVVVFVCALAAGLPLPLLPTQLLWLNLVANGIQDVALAFEPAEGGELTRPPRAPAEPIFDKVMMSRVLLASVPAGVFATVWFGALLAAGRPLDEARSALLLGFVLLENALVGAARSEHRSVFTLSPLRNPLLLIGTLGALGLHVGAMFTPLLAGLLRLTPVTLLDVSVGVIWAAAAVGALELHRLLTSRARDSKLTFRQ